MRIQTTVELFAGIGGFRLAADSLGIRTLWANDVDERASRVYQHRFGAGEFVLGDIRELLGQIPEHDLLTGGFPCQPFSSAGKKEGVRDPRGTLFQSVVDVVAAKQPRYFILENVKRLLSMESGAHFSTVLTSLSGLRYDIEWRLVNVKELGLPQNRQRVIIFGSKPDTMVEPPRLHLVTQTELTRSAVPDMDMVRTPSAWRPLAKHGRRFPFWGVVRDGRFFAADITDLEDAVPTPALRDVLESRVDKSFDFTADTIERLRNSKPVNDFVGGVQILSNQRGGARMGYTVFGVDGLAPTLTSTTSRHYERYQVGTRYRRLTNIEYARIQGFPDDHCASTTVYSQYALYGNAIPPQLARWAIERIDHGWCPEAQLPDAQLRLLESTHA